MNQSNNNKEEEHYEAPELPKVKLFCYSEKSIPISSIEALITELEGKKFKIYEHEMQWRIGYSECRNEFINKLKTLIDK